MKKLKNFINRHKKTVVPVIAVSVLLLAGGCLLAAADFTAANDSGSGQTAQEKEIQNKKTAVDTGRTEEKTSAGEQAEKAETDSKTEEKKTADSSAAETEDTSDKNDQKASEQKNSESADTVKTSGSTAKIVLQRKAVPQRKVQADPGIQKNPEAPPSPKQRILINGQIIRQKRRSGYLRW